MAHLRIGASRDFFVFILGLRVHSSQGKAGKSPFFRALSQIMG